ncbi:stage V sporulation protein B [Alkalibacillus haloalkaliphilus]|uniref:Stage V sporulation protein B n=1 Tax=Alkalibacillus haloalkaliphilus TaxID=94136 RepID=A0A511WAT6_9BACI|nr:stage V sporulation protein B [Alkalibacillus haloalkaliphilus]GEN46432.1 stage V sporulation protein B [Alkalibacillus haloalkaliphilus]
MSKQTFIKGAIILIIAGMISRLLGFVNRIVLARLLGEEGIGIYMLTLPALFLMITLSQIGIPVAVSKLVAEANTENNKQKINQILKLSFTITISLSLVLTTLFITAAPFVSNYLILDDRTYLPMLMISPIIIIIAISSVLRGYFQGLQNMKPQATSQVIEQVVRIVFVVIIVKMMLPYGITHAAAGAMVSIVIGELVSLFYMYYCFKKHKKSIIDLTVHKGFKKMRSTLNSILHIALPTAGTRLIGSTTYFLEPILVSQSLIIAGYTISESTKLYGQLAGYVLPLLLLPTFITHSLSVALIPSISEANALKHYQTVHYRIRQALRLSFASGGIATIIFLLLAPVILQLMYGNDNGAKFLMFMAPFFLLLYFQAPLQAALQALDYAKHAMVNSLIGAVVKLAVLWLLATKPSFGIDGVVISIVVGVLVVTLLHFITLYKLIKFRMPFWLSLRMITLVILVYIMGTKIESILITGSALISTILIITTLIFIYIVGLFLFKIVSKDEWEQLKQGRF